MKLEEINNRTKDAVSYLVEALESGQSEVLTQYLSAMGRFHNYSFGNIMLIARQKPDATNVAGLRTWNSLGRFVKRGEKGIMILAPMIGHKKADSVAEATEDAKQSQAQLYGFRAVYVFDISQTEGKDLTALVGVDERVRVAHREAVNVALDELERYVQARIGGNHQPETTGRWVAAKFEHDSSRPVDGYAAPQLHTHVVIFNVTERENGDTRALQPHELYRSQQYATAVYRTELALRLKQLGYEMWAEAQMEHRRSRATPQEYLEAQQPTPSTRSKST